MQIVGYKGKTVLIEVNTYNYYDELITASSAILNIYSVDAAGAKTYEVTNANMIISGSLCTYIWISPQSPPEDDFIFDVIVVDSEGNTSFDRGQILLQSETVNSPDPGSGLSATEHDWLYAAFAKTASLTYTPSNFLKTDVYSVNNNNVTSVDDFKADVSDVGLNPEQAAWLENIYNQTEYFTFDTNNVLNTNIVSAVDGLRLGLTDQEHGWLNLVYQKTDGLSYGTNGFLKSDIYAVNDVLITIGDFRADLSGVALEDTNLTILNNVGATYNLTNSVYNNMALEVTAQSILNVVNSTNTSISNNIELKTDAIYNVLLGDMMIDSLTGILTHYKFNTSTPQIAFQLKDKDNVSTTDIGDSYGRVKV